jgi:serine/threonine protein kinase
MLARMPAGAPGKVMMTGQPLRPGDPTLLGRYRITARLGEGGMGSVYLAATPDGRPVALKVIRGELAGDDEFRRRFRSEVARAREVPPFCTAEVLDADTEHEPPYLVVEYVDGPSLAVVIRERGPLTPANQHGLAVGVAVALTAIHGAGVIHRDLKPSNVLLAPGSPKVIDFGIARATSGSEAETAADQLVGTVPYMAPERFDSRAFGPLTPASDVFSWGAVIAYAAIGRSPFGAEVPSAVAVRIMTSEPDLDGLSGPLREVVRASLAKNPADRPSARQLLDHLLGGRSEAPTRPAAFPQQPEVLAAAGIQPTLLLPPVPAGPATAPTVYHGPTVPGQGLPQAYQAPPPGDRPPYVAPYPPPGPRRATPRPRRPRPGPPPRRRGMTAAVTLLSLVVLLLGGAIAAAFAGYLPLPGQVVAGPSTPATATTDPAVRPTSSGTDPTIAPGAVPSAATATTPDDPTLVAGASLVLDDRFPVDDAYWLPTSVPDIGGECTVDGRLTATLTRKATGSYRCRGVVDRFTDVTVKVDVELGNAASCAGVWFRYTDRDAQGGYALRICQGRIQVVTHSGTSIEVLKEFSHPVGVGRTVSVALRAQGQDLAVFAGDTRLGTVTDATFTEGRVVLGVFAIDGESTPPYAATFHRVQLYRP